MQLCSSSACSQNDVVGVLEHMVFEDAQIAIQFCERAHSSFMHSPNRYIALREQQSGLHVRVYCTQNFRLNADLETWIEA